MRPSNVDLSHQKTLSLNCVEFLIENIKLEKMKKQKLD